MSYKVHPRELASVIALRAVERLKYCTAKIADWKEVWGLKDDGGWLTVADDAGHEAVPVWPARAFAEAYRDARAEGHVAGVIDLQVWIERWLPGLKRDGKYVAAFPVPRGQGVVIDPIDFRNAILAELELIENEEE